MKSNIAVFFGGKSVEHEVSVITAMQTVAALRGGKYEPIPVYLTKDGRMYTGENFSAVENYRDINALLKSGSQVALINNGCDPALFSLKPKLFAVNETTLHAAILCNHGTYGEDGTVAGMCESVGLPYAGCDVLSAAISMSKPAAKAILREAGLPVLDGVCVTVNDFNENLAADKIETAMNKAYPMIVKPADLGSSVGISRADNRAELVDALALAFKFTLSVLVEPCVTPLREINCAVLGDFENARASVCERPFSVGEFLSYQDKYLSGGKGAKGMASGGRRVPADIEENLSEKIRDLAVRAFKAMGCHGVSRIDFILDQRDGVYINELNTVPGSLSFYLWEASGLKFPDLCDELVKLALKRNRRRNALMTAIPTNILAHTNGLKGAKT